MKSIVHDGSHTCSGQNFRENNCGNCAWSDGAGAHFRNDKLRSPKIVGFLTSELVFQEILTFLLHINGQFCSLPASGLVETSNFGVFSL